MFFEAKGEYKEYLLSLGLGNEIKGRLFLHPIECFYIIEKGYANEELKNHFDRIFESFKKEFGESCFKKTYFVYKHLMDKGYNCGFSFREGFIAVGRKGYRRGEKRTKYLIRVVCNEGSNRESFKQDLEVCLKARKKLVYAFVDLNKNKVRFVKIDKKEFV